MTDEKLMLETESKIVHICMVTRNRLALTRKCLHLLQKNTRHPYTLTIVDNGSDDGSRDFLAQKPKPAARIILLNRNYGVAPAANAAWALHNDRLMLKLDNDIMLHRPGWLTRMATIVRENHHSPDFGALSINLFQNEPRGKSVHPTRLPSGHNVNTPDNTAEVFGGCVLVSPILHKKYGFWCPDFGQYGWEDTEWGIRLMRDGRVSHYPNLSDTMTHEGLADSEDYMQFKREKFRQFSRRMGMLTLMYALGLRPLYMPRKYHTVFETDGVHARLETRPEYRQVETRLRAFSAFLDKLGIDTEFPCGAEVSMRMAQAARTLRQNHARHLPEFAIPLLNDPENPS